MYNVLALGRSPTSPTTASKEHVKYIHRRVEVAAYKQTKYKAKM